MVGGPVGDEASRVCVACGYSLYGLGEEPRCPECGLVNIPEAYRKQVWELIDSRRWFFSTMFNPFAKRLPGWWWALDRPGDVRRSFKFAAVHILASVLLIFAFAAIADSFVIKTTTVYSVPDPNNPAAPWIDLGEEGVGDANSDPEEPGNPTSTKNSLPIQS